MYTIITREQCNFCDAAKALLKNSSYPYTEYNALPKLKVGFNFDEEG